MYNPVLIGALIFFVVLIASKIFWMAIGGLLIYLGWKWFKTTDTYKKYS